MRGRRSRVVAKRIQRRRQGVTLIEVVASIAIAGSLLSVVIIGGSQHLRQLKQARDKRIATEALDGFLSAWSVSNFNETRIADAVAQSNLSAVGDFGQFGRESSSPGSRTMYARLKSRGRGNLGDSRRVRLTVFARTADRREQNLAYAEILIPD
ncbi:type II secretion system protein [Stieleria neptunia]